MQRIYIYLKQIPKKIRSNLQTRKYKKGINAIVLSIAAMSNNDKKQLTKFSKKIDDYLEGNPISIILNAETARKDKKFIVAEELYNKMLNNPDIKILICVSHPNYRKQTYDFLFNEFFSEILGSYINKNIFLKEYRQPPEQDQISEYSATSAILDA